MANYILRTLLTTFPLPITLWGASGHRSDQTDLFISTRSLSQQADRIFLPPSMTPTAYHIFWSKMQMCTSRPGREGTWWKRERRVVGKSKWGGKSELPSRLWSELSSKERAHRAWVLSSLHSPAAETTHLHPDRNTAIHQKCASLSVVEPIIMKQTRNWINHIQLFGCPRKDSLIAELFIGLVGEKGSMGRTAVGPNIARILDPLVEWVGNLTRERRKRSCSFTFPRWPCYLCSLYVSVLTLYVWPLCV